MMNRDPNREQEALTGEVRLRVPLPIVVPLGALLLIAVGAIGFSRILLSVPHEIATVLAVVTAANILGACAVLASKKESNRSFLSELAIVVLYPVIVGAVIATMNLDEGHAEEGTPPPPPGPDAPAAFTEELVASGTAFNTDELILPAAETHELRFVNEDSVAHNLAIYEDESTDTEIFVGEPITADETTYNIEGPGQPAEAYFQCDIHPNMNGTATFE